MARDLLLQVKDLHTHFFIDEGTVKAVDGVDLRLRQAETVGLVGESGSGKSVFARSLLRLIEPPGRIVAGEVLFEGADVLRLSDREMRALRGGSIAIAFQDPLTTLNPVLRVGPQIAEAIRLHGVHQDRGGEELPGSRRHARDRALERMTAVRLPEAWQRYNQYPHEYSGGMRQRAVLAAALACNPALLLADEPTTALDVTVQATVLDLMREAQREHGTSILLITHDLGVVSHFCERVAVMYAGRLVEFGRTDDVLSSPKHPYTEGLLKCLPSLRRRSALQPIEGEVPNLADLPGGCSFHARCPRAMEVCASQEPPVIGLGEDRWTRCHLHTERRPSGGGADG